jgi:ribosomal protein S18 acetylase RimI-like enzyme
MKIRKATLNDAAGIAKVHVDSWRSTYRGIVSDDFLSSLSYENREERWKNFMSNNEEQQYLFVAEEEGKIVGFASGGLNRTDVNDYIGELFALYILEEYQRRGIGRALFNQMVKHFLSSNIKSMIVQVLEANAARNFYEAMGGEYIKTSYIEIGGKQHKLMIYGWKELKVI